MTCVPIRLGFDNHVPDMTLATSPEPVTSIDLLKNEYRARRTRWTDLSQPIVVEGTLPEQRVADYFAMPGSNLLESAAVKLELFSDLTSTTDLLNMPSQVVLSNLKPLGEWRAGIDPYGVKTAEVIGENVFLLWTERPIKYQRFKLTIEPNINPGDDVDDIQVRMLLIGSQLQFSKNFSYGAEISYLSPPDLIRTASGSYVPRTSQRLSRVMSLDMEAMNDTDRSRLSTMERSLNGRPFIVSAYPNETGFQYDDYSFLARLPTSITYKQVFEKHHEVQNLTLVEV